MRPVKLNKYIHKYVSANKQPDAVHEIRMAFPDCVFFPGTTLGMDSEDCVVTVFMGTIVFKYKDVELNIFYNGIDYIWVDDKTDCSFKGTFDEMLNYIKDSA